jgi:cell volume regulation protein A
MALIELIASIPLDRLLAGLALFLLASVGLSKVAMRFGVPVLLLFLLAGMAAGSEGPGGIAFDYPRLIELIGVVSLGFILFSGGLDTSWDDIRPVMRHGVTLSTLGVLVTALAVGVFTHLALGFTLLEGVLLGAIVASTDAAAVFSILRGKDVRLRGRLKPLLELESGSNDPMAVFLTLAMLQLITTPDLSPLSIVPFFILQMGVGALVGVVVSRSALGILNRIRLEYDGLYPVFTVGLVLLTYGISDLLSGNGFLAVYLVGVLMGKDQFPRKRSIMVFHDGLAWLVQIVMFVTLGLQVYPSRLVEVVPEGVAVALFLLLVARPIAVFTVLAFTRFTTREKLYISWVGLRGAAPIVLAVFPLLAQINRADGIFHLVFFIVLTSVLLQGTLTVPMARWLQVYDTAPQPRSPMAFVMDDGNISSDLLEITVPTHAEAVGRSIIDLHLPKEALIVLIGRADELVVPRGDTVFEAGDRVLLLTSADLRPAIRDLLTRPAAEIP